MKQLLNIEDEIYPKKSLGQNFIHNQEFLKNLSFLIKTNKNTDIIEVGPGKGALTDFLIKKDFKKLFLIEKDKTLYKQLCIKYSSYKKIEIINDDALKINYKNISKNKNLIIVGNLPFNISSQLLLNWISYEPWPSFFRKMYLMFQYELGKRIISVKGSKKYGKLSVLSQSRCHINEVLFAPSSIFYPKPKVDALVLEFTPIKNYQSIDIEVLKSILNKAFLSRRKKIKNTMAEFSFYFNEWDRIKELRAEELDIGEYCDVVENLNKF